MGLYASIVTRIIADKSDITAKVVSAAQSLHLVDPTNRNTRSFQFLLAYFLGLLGHKQPIRYPLRPNGS